MKGETLNVVYLDHVPSVVAVKKNDTSRIGGVEIEVRFVVLFTSHHSLSILTILRMVQCRFETKSDLGRLLWNALIQFFTRIIIIFA